MKDSYGNITKTVSGIINNNLRQSKRRMKNSLKSASMVFLDVSVARDLSNFCKELKLFAKIGIYPIAINDKYIIWCNPKKAKYKFDNKAVYYYDNEPQTISPKPALTKYCEKCGIRNDCKWYKTILSS